jgi:O-antigen/teichoic acid export membrane protein
MSASDDRGDIPGDIGIGARELQSRVLGGVTWSTVSAAVSIPLALGVSVVLARTLGPAGFAEYAFLSFTAPLLVWMATDLGVEGSATRLASQAIAAGRLDEAGSLLGKALGWNLLRLPVAAALVLAVSRPAPWAAALVVASLALVHVGSAAKLSLLAENRTGVQARLGFVAGLVAAGASIGAALAGASPTSIWAVAFASAAVIVPAQIFAADRRLRRAVMRPRLPRRLPKGFWTYGITSLAISIGGMLVFSRSEILVLKALEHQHALAVFALAAGLAQRLTTPIETLLGPLIPALAALDAAHPERLQAGFDRALRLCAAAISFAGAAGVVGTAFAAPLLFGSEYNGVGLVFAALALASLLRAATQPFSALAYAVGRPQLVLGSLAAALVLDVGLAFALIPVIGVWGAVAANVVGVAAGLVLLARAAAGSGSIRRAGVPVVRLAALALVSATAAFAAGLLVHSVSPVASVLVAFLVGPLVYLAVGRGSLPQTDVQVLLDALPRRLRGSRATVLLVRAAL